MSDDTEKEWSELRHWIIKTLEHIEARDQTRVTEIRDMKIELAVLKTKVVFYGTVVAAVISALWSIAHWALVK